MVRDRSRVARLAVAAAVQVRFLLGQRQALHPGGGREAQRVQPLLTREVEPREPVAKLERGEQVALDVQVAGDVRPPEAEVARRGDEAPHGIGGFDHQCRGRLGGARVAPVVRLESDGEIFSEDPRDQVCNRHEHSIPSEMLFVEGNSTDALGDVNGQSAAGGPHRGRGVRSGPVRVLVVEDEAKVADAVRRGLEAEGFAVDVAPDGTEGLWRAGENAYDVIVLDIMLPGLNGYRVCQQLREAENWTPILMLTAKHGEFDVAEALDSGADDYLTKPFSFVVLLARIRALLRRSGRAAPVTHTAGDLRLDPATHRCFRGDVEITLTAREFEALEFLIRRVGEVVSKTEILDNVWDFAFDGDPNIVEVYIRHLRKKLDEPFGRHSIETVRGAGYRLVADDG